MGVAEQNRNILPERRQTYRSARSGTPIVATLLPDCDIAQAMGVRDWWRLPPAIRNPFERLSTKQSETLYRGVMSIVSCNLTGKLPAQLSKLIGTPLAPYRGRGLPGPEEERQNMVTALRVSGPCPAFRKIHQNTRFRLTGVGSRRRQFRHGTACL